MPNEDYIMEINRSDYTILIVDDVMSNVLLLKVLLSNEKFNIITANCGRVALEETKAKKPDLLLLDVMMPDLSGFEVVQELKKDPELRDIPIIFLTALNTTQDIVKGFQCGANDFISKPFNKEELIIRVMHQISLVAAKRIIVEKTKELERTISGRDKLYSVIAHDLRSPMSSIKMVLNLLLVSLPKDMVGEDTYQLLSMANMQTEEVFSLLDNLLKWTKSQIGRINVVHQNFSTNEFILSVIDIFNMVAQMKNIKIDYVKDDSTANLEIYADIDMAKTVLRNLLSNAIKFSNENSTIKVFVTQKEGMAYVNIQDSGCGISEEDQAKLFHSDTHFTKYGTANEEGSGLGLLLCKDFAMKNGGDLFVQSEIGVGSTFSFSLPLKKD